jgi:hypothetical protein
MLAFTAEESVASTAVNVFPFRVRKIVMLMPLTADDIVVGVLHFAQSSLTGEKKLSADRRKLHRAFFEIIQKHAIFSNEFTFRNRDAFQESTELDQAFSNLDATGFISRYNQTPRYYIVEPALEEGYQKFSKKILEGGGIKEEFLKEAAAILLEKAADAAL